MHAALQSQRLLNTSVFIVWRRSHCLFHPRKEGNMKLTYPICCGVDVHKTFLVATIITSEYVMPH